MRRWRRISLTFIEEQKKINDWLVRVRELSNHEYAIAVEVAQFPRVLRGYGDTYLRGRRNFEALMSAVSGLLSKSDAADRLKKVREAAMADDTGDKLTAALHQVTS